jgi:hypothetical protein
MPGIQAGIDQITHHPGNDGVASLTQLSSTKKEEIQIRPRCQIPSAVPAMSYNCKLSLELRRCNIFQLNCLANHCPQEVIPKFRDLSGDIPGGPTGPEFTGPIFPSIRQTAAGL